jgi:hypothetical protein
MRVLPMPLRSMEELAVTASRSPATLRTLQAAFLNAETFDARTTDQWRSSALMAGPTFLARLAQTAVASDLQSEVQLQ